MGHAFAEIKTNKFDAVKLKILADTTICNNFTPYVTLYKNFIYWLIAAVVGMIIVVVESLRKVITMGGGGGGGDGEGSNNISSLAMVPCEE